MASVPVRSLHWPAGETATAYLAAEVDAERREKKLPFPSEEDSQTVDSDNTATFTLSPSETTQYVGVCDVNGDGSEYISVSFEVVV